MHELLTVAARMGSGAVVDDDLLLAAVTRKHSLLEADEEGHEVVLVGRRSQLHHSSVFEAGTDGAEDCGSHLTGVADVQHRLLLLRPALRLHLH